MKYLIVGRVGRGKSELAKKLSELGLVVAESYTTRPPRTQNEKGHIFITNDEAAAIPESDKLLRTTSTGYEYFMTKEIIEAADVLIVDPNGVKDISELLPETAMHIIYMITDNMEKCQEFAVNRSDNPEAELEKFKIRAETEDDMFNKFVDYVERFTTNSEEYTKNISSIRVVDNDYTPEHMKNLANHLIHERQLSMNIVNVLKESVEMGVLQSEKKGTISMISYQNRDDSENAKANAKINDVPYELAIADMLNDKNMLFKLLIDWLTIKKM